MGLRARVISLVSTIVAAAQLAWGFGIVRSEAAMLREEAARRGSEVLRALAVPCAVSLANGEIETLDAALDRFAGEGSRDLDLRWVAILDGEGAVVAHTDPRRFGSRPDDGFSLRALRERDPIVEPATASDGAPVLHLSMPVVSGLRWGTATAELSMERVEARVARTRLNVLAASAGVAAGVAAVLAVLLSTQVIRRVRAMSEAARRISEGALDVRAPPDGGRDELGLLGRTFNRMAEEIESTTRGLEAKVAERTRQLREANDALGQTNTDLAQAVGRLEELARTDGLTGLLNHRTFHEMLDFEVRRARRSNEPISVLMIDVDHFKQYNDAHGHPAGDKVLTAVATTFREGLRSTDLVARYGGEEFAVVLPGAQKEAARAVAEKLREAVTTLDFPEAARSQPGGRLGISVGVATWPADGETDRELIRSADRALYEAKRQGRDRVCLA